MDTSVLPFPFANPRENSIFETEKILLSEKCDLDFRPEKFCYEISELSYVVLEDLHSNFNIVINF